MQIKRLTREVNLRVICLCYSYESAYVTPMNESIARLINLAGYQLL
jgi:hypothetical protein